MTNPELELAKNFVENTHRNLFLTGKAGTGKTTFLRSIKEHTRKRLVIVAPTGVAAINAQGVTIHSFFQMPFGPLVPHQTNENFLQKKFNKQKINIIRSLDLLIIDEISMVRADLLDGIDQVLRRYKDRKKPFGGVQILMIGDIQQLAPIVKPDEWSLLSPYFQTPFFFSSKAYGESNVLSIELKKIYRQSNKEFIDILEEVRNNALSNETLHTLNQRYQPTFVPPPDEGFITLTTHNNSADLINENELHKLKKKSYFFKAQTRGNFPEYSYPTHENLELKEGSQVMFVKNDSDPSKRYYNGKIGKIISISDDYLLVKSPEDEDPIEVSTEKWQNFTYTLNPENQNIEEEEIGSFVQIPLKLAWAITIHKSQGLTFDKAVIDAQASFAHGQTYVALSRCKTLEGIVLKTKIFASSIINDVRVHTFTEDLKTHIPDESQLALSQKQYQLQLLEELFDFFPLQYPLKNAIEIYYKNTSTLKGNIVEPLTKIKEEGLIQLLKVSESFKNQLHELSKNVEIPEKNAAIQERISKAVSYYYQFVKDHLLVIYDSITFATDNKEVIKDLERQLDFISDFISQKIYCLNGLTQGFSVFKYLELRAKAAIQKEELPRPKKEVFTDTKHRILFDDLRSLRMEFSETEMVEPYQIFTQASLFEMCEKLPQNLAQLRKINGMGKVRIKKYGEAILDVILEYCELNQIVFETTPSEVVEKEKEKMPKGGTYLISLNLFKEGKSLSEIATERNLALSTIEGHLMKYIPTGEIKITDLISEEKFAKLKKAIENIEFENLTDLRSKVGTEYSFLELRMVTDEKISNTIAMGLVIR